MAINVGTYLPPGSYISEEVVKPIPAFVGLPRQICLIGEGEFCKTFSNERHVRAYVDQEIVTPDNNGVFVTAKQTDNNISTMFLFKNGDQEADGSFTIINDVKPAAPTVALLSFPNPSTPPTGHAPTSGGSVDPGAHSYRVTYLTDTGETATSAQSNVVNTVSGFETVDVDIPVSPSKVHPGGFIHRNVYRTEAGADPTVNANYHLVSTVTDNTTTSFVDTASDASINGNASPPTTNTAPAGSVNNGTHVYLVTFIINGQESNAGAVSSAVSVVDNTQDGQVDVTNIPVGPPGTTARRLYRSAANTATPLHRVTTISDNTSTEYVDDFSDAAISGNPVAPSAATGITKVTIAPTVFDPSASYTFSYQSLASLYPEDKLLQDVTGICGTITGVGSFPGTHNFVSGVDYSLDTVTNSIQWLGQTAAKLTGSKTGPYDFSAAGLKLLITIDGGHEQVVTFSNVNGVDFVTASAATATEVAAKIAAVLAGDVTANATDVPDQVTIISDSIGPDSSLTIGNGNVNSILGFTMGAFAQGAGSSPAQGQEYFVTYKAARPDTDFNRPILSTSFDQFVAQFGVPSSTNALALAGQIVFEQQPPFVFAIQVKKSDPTLAAAKDIDYTDAIKGAELNPDLTDIIVLGHPTVFAGGTKPLVRAALRDHVISESSIQNKAERMGWFGMPVGTQVGDGETPGTFVFVATQELQVAADSPGRGRFVLNAPSFIQKTYRFSDGSVKQLTLDSTYLAAGVAAVQASFLNPSEGLLRKEVVGFDAVELLTIGDRNFMASQGVNVIQARAGLNVVFDPTTTDQSSAEFKEINVMAQKDNIVKRVRTATDNSLIGLVPDDLNQFVFELKTVVASQLTGAIADGTISPFQNDDGTVRNIDLQNDIIVRRRASDPTAYDFRFSFFVKFIVKRLFGTFSVVIPSGV